MLNKAAISLQRGFLVAPKMTLIVLALVAPLYAFGNLVMLLSERPMWGISLSRIPSRAYGPFPLKKEPPRHYRFHAVPGSLGNFPLWRIEEFTRSDFEELMLRQAPRSLREGMKRWLAPGLRMAQKYQVDPFWVMAVMWVESHFNPRAKSPVYAMGLMQILPRTGHFLRRLTDRPVSAELIYSLLEEPETNVELGVFYLRRLLARFTGSYRLATVAYNMGPTTVQKRLRLGLPVGRDNRYLTKVRRAYFKLSRGYRTYLAKTPPAFQDTWVARKRKKPARLYALAF